VRGDRFHYGEVALVTRHEEHNGVEVVGGAPHVIRSTAGTFADTPVGEQVAALGGVDLLFVPVGDGPTIGAALAHEIARMVGARWVVPMHYRTHRTNFLEPADAFLERFPSVSRPGSSFTLDEVADGAVAPAAP
jgi:L-ascorbate metabolism protein UlaG (beta-lactamase superfamily)